MILMRSDYMTYSRALGLSNMLLFQLISYCSSIPWTDYLFSGHLPVHCKLKAVKFSFKRSQISFRKMKSISADILQDELSRGGEWYLKKRESRKILAGSRNLGNVFDKSRSLVFSWFVFTFFDSRNFSPKSLGLGFLTRILASRRVSDFTIRHPSF